MILVHENASYEPWQIHGEGYNNSLSVAEFLLFELVNGRSTITTSLSDNSEITTSISKRSIITQDVTGESSFS